MLPTGAFRRASPSFFRFSLYCVKLLSEAMDPSSSSSSSFSFSFSFFTFFGEAMLFFLFFFYFKTLFFFGRDPDALILIVVILYHGNFLQQVAGFGPTFCELLLQACVRGAKVFHLPLQRDAAE